MAIVGVDVGTQSLKAVVTSDQLATLGEASSRYRVDHPRPGWAQQDPLLWERALGEAIAAALERAGCRPEDVRALGLAGQLDGCVAVDRQGAPLGPCLIWMDRRAETEMPELDPTSFRETTGLVADAGHMGAKIRWLRRHAAGLEGARFHQPVSYMVERLTGAFVFDHGLASTTMLYALGERDLSPALCRTFEIEPDALPAIAEADALAGEISSAGAALCGLPAGTPVAVGTGDDFATPLGAGVIAPGPVACVVGTAEVVGALSREPVLDEGGLVETHGYAGGRFFVENPGWLSGGALTWLGELLAEPDPAVLDREAAAVAPGSDGLLFLPALSGAMAPEWIASARGCFYGLTPAHGRGHLVRALMEGCAFAMRDVIDRLRELGVPAERVLLLGGGARSEPWAQIRADVTGLPVSVASRVDTCPVGAAMLAAVASGTVDGLEACAALVEETSDVIPPDPARRSRYAKAHGRYRQLFDVLRPMYR